MKTVLITGCSSGFGLEITRHFLSQGWKVIATMRSPRTDVLPPSDNLRVLPLDVTIAESIREAVEAAGDVDALVNNAGVGMLGALEGTSMEVVREVFAINTLGTIAVTQALLPQFRTRRAGAIINITSSVTSQPLPLLSVYTASKAAVNAFTDSLALELKQFNVTASLVIPGRAPATQFGSNAKTRIQNGIPEAYGALAQSIFARWAESSPITLPEDVAEAVWCAVNDSTPPSRVYAGVDAVLSVDGLATGRILKL